MNLYRLTYFVSHKTTAEEFPSDQRFEVYGSDKAIMDMWFHLTQLEKLHITDKHPSACPRFIKVYDKYNHEVDMTKGIYGFNKYNDFE